MIKAIVPQEKFSVTSSDFDDRDASGARRDTRPAYWPELGGFVETTVYQLEELKNGNQIEGPALIESPHTTVVVPPNAIYTVDQYLNGVIEKKMVEGVLV